MNEIEIKRLLENDSQQLKDMFDIGWLVGIIDGEGCFGLNKATKSKYVYYNSKIQIVNTNIKIISNIERILKKFYINYCLMSHQDKRGLVKRKLTYRIGIQGHRNLKRFFNIFGDFFTCKKGQADLLRKYIDSRLTRGKHQSNISEEEILMTEELKELNKKGQEDGQS